MALDKQSTFDKVIQVVSDKLNKDKESIVAAHSFEELGADSLDMVEIVLTLEEQFNIEINDEDAEKLTSIQQVVDYIHNLRSE